MSHFFAFYILMSAISAPSFPVSISYARFGGLQVLSTFLDGTKCYDIDEVTISSSGVTRKIYCSANSTGNENRILKSTQVPLVSIDWQGLLSSTDINTLSNSKDPDNVKHVYSDPQSFLLYVKAGGKVFSIQKLCDESILAPEINSLVSQIEAIREQNLSIN